MRQSNGNDSSLPIRLTLSPSDKELFERWCKSFSKSRSSCATHMVVYFLRTIPPGSPLPQLPSEGESGPTQGRLL